MQTRILAKWIAPALLLLAMGCAGAGETAVVTERPEGPPAVPTTPQPPPTVAQPVATGPDTVRAGRFDTGKMWTFDNPPIDYFEEAYGFRPDSAWFERARLGALRLATFCSASFVSPGGLVMTNHHCARESISQVSRPGEDLLDNGFYARTMDEERRVKDLYVEQLIEIRDVTGEVNAAVASVTDDERRAELLRTRIEQIEARMTSEVKLRDTTLNVQVVELYNGGRYSAYTFRRYGDVRLVMAPELQIGSFGGDPDNFTYPRYGLDMSFFRVYGPDGEPLSTEHYFRWSDDGTRPGDVVFVVGSPGSTSRLSTVSQLAFERDYSLPDQLEVMNSRARILNEYIEANPALADSFDLRNTYFSIRNSIKATEGQLRGLRDPYLIARRQAGERELREAIAARDSLRRAYGDVLGSIVELQRTKEAAARQAGAFAYFGSPMMDSHVLVRALYGYIYDFLRQRGASPDQYEEYRKEGLEVEDWPREVEKAYLAERLRLLQARLGETDPTVRRILQGRTPEALAEQVVENTALIDSAGFAQLLEKGYLGSNDPTVPLIQALAPLYISMSQQQGNIEARESNLNARLARARFDVFGTRIPPDASFSLRLADGVVRGYTYNGTLAPAHTTFYGLYNHYHSYAPRYEEWDLPERWLSPPPTFDLSTQNNLVSTNDITGGNSGSPLLNRDLEVVGLIFDSNIEALPNQYLYTDITARAISVDSRGILEALDDMYDADRIVLELTTGRVSETEEAADAAIGQARE